MKVCTDACLFGALLSTRFSIFTPSQLHALDIGTGTGLLSLMYAQENERAIIDAVEIDENAAQQAKENFDASPWSRRLSIINIAIQDFSNNQQKKYVLIFSNPPFFEDDLKSKDEQRNLALHSISLHLNELFITVKKLLDVQGVFAVLLPYHRTEQAIQLGKESNLHLQQKILVKQTPNHNYFRSILVFSENTGTESLMEICIKDETNNYSKEFTALLKGFYLRL